MNDGEDSWNFRYVDKYDRIINRAYQKYMAFCRYKVGEMHRNGYINDYSRFSRCFVQICIITILFQQN